MGLQKEFQEFLNKWNESREDGYVSPQEIHDLIREGVDIIAAVLNASDSEDMQAEIAIQLEAVVAKLANGMLANNPILRMVAMSAVGTVSRQAVDAIADYTGTVEGFWLEHIDPVLARWEATIHSLRQIGA